MSWPQTIMSKFRIRTQAFFKNFIRKCGFDVTCPRHGLAPSCRRTWQYPGTTRDVITYMYIKILTKPQIFKIIIHLIYVKGPVKNYVYTLF